MRARVVIVYMNLEKVKNYGISWFKILVEHAELRIFKFTICR